MKCLHPFLTLGTRVYGTEKELHFAPNLTASSCLNRAYASVNYLPTTFTMFSGF